MRRSCVSNSTGKAARGFSLIEVVIAIAIIAVALVGILGLFPIALDAASNSQRETQAALLARTIYTDLDARADTKRLLLTTTNSTGTETKPSTFEVDLTKASDAYLAYDTDGEPMGKIDAGAFSSGKKEATFVAHVAVKPQPATPNGTNSTVTELTRIEVSVQTPASAPEASRRKYSFISLYRQGTKLTPLPPPSP